MTTQFVFDVTPNTYAIRQILPLHFKDRYFNGKKWVYLINNNMIRHKVRIGLVSNIQLELYDIEWVRFVEDSGYQNMATLHFIHESADTFYVTGYGISGSESGGYDELLTRGRMTRCFARLGQNVTQVLLAGDFVPEIESGTLNVTVNGNIFTVTHRRQLLPGSLVNYGSVFFGNGWDDLVQMLRLTPEIPLVFTKVFGETFSMMVFAADGWELTHENLARTKLALVQPIKTGENDPRMLQICRWAGHDRHFDESDTFYRPLLAHVTKKGRLTIPAEFVRKHELYTYDNAILHHRGVEYKVRLCIVKHRKKPHLKSHVIMKGKWNTISRECGFTRNKMIRFKYVADMEDEDEVELIDFPVVIPMFEIC